MTKSESELPAATENAARDGGSPTPTALDRPPADAIGRGRGADSLLGVADRVAQAGIAPMPMDETDAEVKAYRTEQRRARGRGATAAIAVYTQRRTARLSG
jgi:hypothetical protein